MLRKTTTLLAAIVALASSAQTVAFPQLDQPGEAVGTVSGDTLYTLSNDLFSANFKVTDNVMTFDGSEVLGLKEGTPLFYVTLGDGSKVSSCEMVLGEVSLEAVSGNDGAVVGSEKFNGYILNASFDHEALHFNWQAVLRDGSHYLRTVLNVTANGHDVAMSSLTPMYYETPAATAPVVVGNTRGAVLASQTIFAGLETPTAYNTVTLPIAPGDKSMVDEGFSINSWMADTQGDTQPSNPAYWNWVPANDTPSALSGLGFRNTDIRGKRGFAKFKNAGTHTATFQYQSGTHGLNIIGVDAVDATGNVVASDYHIGFTGGASRNNTFTLNIPEAGNYILRYFIEIRTETSTSTGSVTWNPAIEPADGFATATNPGTEPDEEISIIQGLWSRQTTLATGDTWSVSAVVGLIAPGQARRSFLCYSERERAVPWRAFPLYNSWYELNIDRNNSATYDGHMTAQQCADVVQQWKTNLFDPYDVNIKSFVWDDGWDEYGTWDFNKNFPNGFKEPYEIAKEYGTGTGAWLGPVGGYGVSGSLRRQYWADKGGMILSNPAYYNVFLGACEKLVNEYDFNFFKLDGISTQFSSTGPDDGAIGNENAEGIIKVLREVRKIRPDMFFNTTVGTWASPFWFHYTDAVWRQENDYGTAGNQGSDRERWITYRDRLVYQNFVQNSPLCPINTLMTHGLILTRFGSVSTNMDYEGIVREMRCAFACGSGMVELYCDANLLNTINSGALWGDLAECIKWQEKNADVLPDIHWVGGNPWDGSNANVYGWASWNGSKSTLALRNPSTANKTFTFTLRQVLEIPDHDTNAIELSKAFVNQPDLSGLTEGEPIDIDTEITVALPGSSVYVFDGALPGPKNSMPVVSTDTTDNRVFDLLGRQVENANLARGIYVKEGKKFAIN